MSNFEGGAAVFFCAQRERRNAKRPMIFLCFFAWIDVTLLGGPAYNSMLEYRAKVIGRNVSRMVIVQGNLSYSGAKQVALPNHLMKRLKRLVPGGVTLLNVPFPEKVESQWDRERIHRWYTVQWLLANEPDAVAFISDGDEIIDPKVGVDNLIGEHADCIRPMLRSSYYSPCCEMEPIWTKSVVIRTSSRTFRRWKTMSPEAVNKAIRDERSGSCIAEQGSFKNWLYYHFSGLRPRGYIQGWHMSYALNTKDVREKMSAFSHSQDKLIIAAMSMRNAEISERIRNCQSIFDKNMGKKIEEGPFPPPGWPRHPDAPDC